uniref:Uncharacterized protein n=1 Tax=Malurus cyaneus samueli TaxID=2593467 RepID=A0A8C5TFQ8_9PASS
MQWSLLCCLPCRERRERELHEAYKNAKTQEEAESILQQYIERFTISEAAVPMLTPKPYSQPKNTQEVLKNFKVDGKVSMNGENVNGLEEKDKECTTVIFAPSPTRSLKFDGVARGDRPPVELKKDPPSVELSLQRPATQSVHKEPTVRPTRANQNIRKGDKLLKCSEGPTCFLTALSEKQINFTFSSFSPPLPQRTRQE